jgi:hypothetical protein
MIQQESKADLFISTAEEQLQIYPLHNLRAPNILQLLLKGWQISLKNLPDNT